MGKGYNNYMCKKPFHPGSKANIKRAWMAEQKTENEKKKQEELKVQYEKEQELYNNRSLLSTESKDKLELNFMYQAPPGAKKERQKEDDEPEFKFEWQRKYNAPREDYAKGNADIKDQPFGIPVRNVRCIKCHKWGHINTDKECPLFSQASTSSMPTTSMDPMELMKQMREDGYGLKENVLGHHLNPAAANQQLIPSDESDPEMEFLKSLSASEKKKLLRKLKKLSKKQEKASRCKKKKSKKSGKSKSKDKTSDHKKKKSKKCIESESSDESGSESSSEESAEEEKQKKHSKKHSSNRKSKERDPSETSDSELDKPKTSKNEKVNQGKKALSEKNPVKSDVSSSQKKIRSVSSDSENESNKNKYKISKHSKSKKSKGAAKEKNNSSDSGSEFEEDERKKFNHLKKEKSRKSTKSTVDISSESDQARSLKTNFEHSIDKKSKSHDKITKNLKKSRSKDINIETSKEIRTYHKKRSSSESQDEKSSHGYSESRIKHKSVNYEKKQMSADSKPRVSKDNNYKNDDRNEKIQEQKSIDNVNNPKRQDLKRSDKSHLHEEMNPKRKADKEPDTEQKRRNDDNFNYEEKTKKKNNEENIKTELKNTYSDSNEELSKSKTCENETSKLKRKKIDLEFVEQKKIYDEEPSTSHFKKTKNSSDSGEVEKFHRTDEYKHLDCTKKTDESKMGELSSQKRDNTKPDSEEKHDSGSKNLIVKQKCDSPLHPDGFSHLCPQARIEANYVQIDEGYQGKKHDNFRHFNRERRSPSVKQKYNS